MTKKQLRDAENKRMAAANARFEKLSPWRKRVAIARDVLAQLASGRFSVEKGVYLRAEQLQTVNNNSRSDLQTVFGQIKSCTVCALGSMFVCGVQIADKLKVNQVNIDRATGQLFNDDIYDYLKRFFDLDQLILIESAFEKINMLEQYDVMDELGGGYYELQDAIHMDAIEFGTMVYDSETRLRLIMENIVANKGTFEPSIRPTQVWSTPGFTK